jgi:hypothetical protein
LNVVRVRASALGFSMINVNWRSRLLSGSVEPRFSIAIGRYLSISGASRERLKTASSGLAREISRQFLAQLPGAKSGQGSPDTILSP